MNTGIGWASLRDLLSCIGRHIMFIHIHFRPVAFDCRAPISHGLAMQIDESQFFGDQHLQNRR
jgi:hypothetical protein